MMHSRCVRVFAAGALCVAVLCSCVGPDGGGREGEGEGEGEGEESQPPIVNDARASAVGRQLDRLRIEVSGTDADGDASGILVRFKDSADRDLVFFDTDLDGRADSASAVVAFDAIVVDGAAFDAHLTIQEAPPMPGSLAAVLVSVIDGAQQPSAERRVPVVLPPVVGEGGACDVDFVTSRCSEGLGCKGTPPVCAPPEAPHIARGAFLLPSDPELLGPRLAIEGIDADQDVTHVTLEFFDDEGANVTLDLDGDDVPDADTFDVSVVDDDGGAPFAISHEMGLGLHELVQRIAMTPHDALGLVGERLEVRLSTPPLRQLGQACSVVGFDVCANDGVCATNATGATSCQSPTALRNGACGAADVVVVRRAEPQSISGETQATSAFELPDDCAPNSPTGRPDAVVILDVQDDLGSLRVSTASAATSFDTIVTILPSCTAPMSEALACADDGEGTVASTVTLSALPRGRYAVVIDSFRPEGGRFGLEIQGE